MNRTPTLPHRRTRWAAWMLAAAAWQLTGCASVVRDEASAASVAAPGPDTVESVYGISVVGLQLSAAGTMLDLRYRVVDAAKAAPLLDRKQKPVLLDPMRGGARLGVPDTPVLGQIRQTSRNNVVYTDRNYFIMFGNPGRAVQRGDTLTLMLGQAKITDLTVR